MKAGGPAQSTTTEELERLGVWSSSLIRFKILSPDSFVYGKLKPQVLKGSKSWWERTCTLKSERHGSDLAI